MVTKRSSRTKVKPKRTSSPRKITKAELEEKLEVRGSLLFEAVHLLKTEEDYGDYDRQELVGEFLGRCLQEGIA